MNIKKNFSYNILFVVIVFFITSINFYNIEPGIDQIRHISWAQNLTLSEYFIDWNKDIYSKEILFDKKSFFVNLFKTAYSDIGNLFNLVPILFLYVLSFVSSNEIYTFNILSIFFFSGNILVTILILKEIFGYEFKKINYLYLLIFKLSLISFYTFHYSPLGVHNMALFFFLLTVLLLVKNNFEDSKKNLFYVFISLGLAIYSHKINVILLIPLILFYFLFLKDFKLLRTVIIYILLILSPVIIAFLLAPEVMSSTRKFTEIDFNFYTYIMNFFIWFENIIKTLGPITLFFFLMGLYFAIIEKEKYLILIIFVLIHLFCNSFLNSFSFHYLRTYLYITPIIFIISFIGLYNFITNVNYPKIVNIFLITLFCINILFNFSLNFSSKFQNYVNHKVHGPEHQDRVFHKVSKTPMFIRDYYYKFSNKIYPFLLKNKQYMSDNYIIFFDNSTEDYFKIYMKDLYLANGVYIKPVKNLVARGQKKINLKNLNLEKLVLLSISPKEKHILDKLEELNKSRNFFSKCSIVENKYYDIEKKIINGVYNMYIHKLICTKI